MSIVDENFIHDILLDDDVYEAILCWAKAKYEGDDIDITIMSATVVEDSVEVYMQFTKIIINKDASLFTGVRSYEKGEVTAKKDFIPLDELERLVALESLEGVKW